MTDIIDQNDSREKIAGLKPVMEVVSIQGFSEYDELFLARDPQDRRIRDLLTKLKRTGGQWHRATWKKLTEISGHENHQGVVLVRQSGQSWPQLSQTDILESSSKSIYVVVDGIQDPGNLGAIIRSMAAFGASGLILPVRNNAPLNTAVWKTSAGMLGRMPVLNIKNLTQFLKEIKKSGACYIVGAAQDGVNIEDFKKENITHPNPNGLILILGGEEKGISRPVRELCDIVLSLKINQDVESLNVSVAAGILLYLLRS